MQSCFFPKHALSPFLPFFFTFYIHRR
jgi:hypothetical protein